MLGPETGFIPEEVQTIAKEAGEENKKTEEELKKDIFDASRFIDTAGKMSSEELAELPPSVMQVITAVAALQHEVQPLTNNIGPENPPPEHKTQPLLKINIDEGKKKEELQSLTESDFFQELQRKSKEMKK